MLSSGKWTLAYVQDACWKYISCRHSTPLFLRKHFGQNFKENYEGINTPADNQYEYCVTDQVRAVNFFLSSPFLLSKAYSAIPIRAINSIDQPLTHKKVLARCGDYQVATCFLAIISVYTIRSSEECTSDAALCHCLLSHSAPMWWMSLFREATYPVISAAGCKLGILCAFSPLRKPAAIVQLMLPLIGLIKSGASLFDNQSCLCWQWQPSFSPAACQGFIS